MVLNADTPRHFAGPLEMSRHPVGIEGTGRVFVGSFVRNVKVAAGGGVVPVEAGDAAESLAGVAVDGGFADNPVVGGQDTIAVAGRGRLETWVTGAVTFGSVGAPVYCADDETLTLAAGTELPFGKIVQVLKTGTNAGNLVQVSFKADGIA